MLIFGFVHLISFLGLLLKTFSR